MADQIEYLRIALFDESLEGIRRTGEVWPLGAFLLVGAMIDTLAGLRYAPANDSDRNQGARYANFVHAYFDSQYRQFDMGPKLWTGLRCRPLHNFAGGEIVLADSQSASSVHLHEAQAGRGILLCWLNFLADYTVALQRYWHDVELDSAIRVNAEQRCARYPPLMVVKVEFSGGVTFPLTFPVTFPVTGASGYGRP